MAWGTITTLVAAPLQIGRCTLYKELRALGQGEKIGFYHQARKRGMKATLLADGNKGDDRPGVSGVGCVEWLVSFSE